MINVKHSAEVITIGEYIEKYQPGYLLDLNPFFYSSKYITFLHTRKVLCSD